MAPSILGIPEHSLALLQMFELHAQKKIKVKCGFTNVLIKNHCTDRYTSANNAKLGKYR